MKKKGGKKEKGGHKRKRKQGGVQFRGVVKSVGPEGGRASYQQCYIDMNIFRFSTPAKGQTMQTTPLTI